MALGPGCQADVVSSASDDEQPNEDKLPLGSGRLGVGRLGMGLELGLGQG